MAAVKEKGFATIDVALVVIRVGELEIAIDTANQVQITPQIETQDAIKLIKNGKLLAQKPGTETTTSHQIVLTDNIFYPAVVKILQGGTITTSEAGVLTYTPPLTGSGESGTVFELDTYSSVYDEAGDIVNYEKTTFPNCKGTPINISMQDDTFRLPEYTINSFAKKGQAPYTIAYIKPDDLPEFTDGTETEVVSAVANETYKLSKPDVAYDLNKNSGNEIAEL